MISRRNLLKIPILAPFACFLPENKPNHTQVCEQCEIEPIKFVVVNDPNPDPIIDEAIIPVDIYDTSKKPYKKIEKLFGKVNIRYNKNDKEIYYDARNVTYLPKHPGSTPGITISS